MVGSKYESENSCRKCKGVIVFSHWLESAKNNTAVLKDGMLISKCIYCGEPIVAHLKKFSQAQQEQIIAAFSKKESKKAKEPEMGR